MDQTQMNQPMQSPQKTTGPLVGIVVIIIVLVLGALYFWGGKLNQQEPPVVPQTTSENGPVLGTSDEVGDITNDLTAAVVNGVDTDTAALQQELNAQ